MNIEELKTYAFKRGLNLGQAEKDYYQTLILFIIYSKVAKELVFKGGTALSKCYGLNRFSEDLDFTVMKRIEAVKAIRKGLDDFGIKYSIGEVKGAETKKYRIKINGILYTGAEKTKCSITLDFSLREKTIIEPKIMTIGYYMDIIPSFEVYAMDEKEIFAEKIRAIYTRESARDLYDLAFLIRKGIRFDKEIADKKLKMYGLEFEKKSFLSRCRSLKNIWDSELQSLVRNIPDFKDIIEQIGNAIEE